MRKKNSDITNNANTEPKLSAGRSIEHRKYIYFVYLGKIAHDVEAFEVIICHDVEEERICVVIQGFVVQETLGQ